MKFIDLFAGLGGFHLALKDLGHECVFASEINEGLQDIYEKNFQIKPAGDIRFIKNEEIPSHDILCAGFPCTPFSKAGKREGRKDEKSGDLFDQIIRILEYHKPSYFILENVPSLFSHDSKKTWWYIENKLKGYLGYSIEKNFYSPHEFGIPQNRKRLFIVGSLNDLNGFKWIDDLKSKEKTDIKSIISANTNSKYREISNQQKNCIKVWQEFLDAIPKTEYLGFPIWAAEFGATYPYKKTTPNKTKRLSNYLGTFGTSLKGLTREEQFKLLPSYARVEQVQFPGWKINFIDSNRKFYNKYKDELKEVIPKIKALPIPSWQKFEWNCQFEPRKINKYILQFRSSGLRVKKNDFAPSLVCPTTQIPIFGWQNRYITKHEALKLHAMEELEYLPDNNTRCFTALGNAVNVKIVKLIAQRLIKDNEQAES